MSDSEDPIDNIPDDGDDDLFGDEGGDATSDAPQALSDRELASDREDNESDVHRREDDEEPREFREKLVVEVPLYRHRIPRSKDGSVSGGFQTAPLPSSYLHLLSCTRSGSRILSSFTH